MGLLDEKTWLIEPVWHFLLTRSFDILSPAGNRLGSITGGSIDLEVRDADENVIATLERPWQLFRVKVYVTDAGGVGHGSVFQVTPLGRIRFEIRDTAGAVIGAISPTKAWATEFDLTDKSGSVLARITRRYRFWRTGSYTVDFDAGSTGATRMFALAGVVALDKAIDGRRSSSAAPVA